MKKQIRLVIDQVLFRATGERPEAKEALNRWAGHVADVFVNSLPAEEAQVLPWFGTPEGRKTLRELWPKIVDAYFHALCNPKRKT